MQLHHTILEAFDGLQIQGHVAGTRRYQWNAIRNEHWGNTGATLTTNSSIACSSRKQAMR